MEKQQIHISLNQDLFQVLNDISTKINKPRSQIINEALINYLEDLEDYLIAKTALDDIKSGKSSIISHAEMKKRLGF